MELIINGDVQWDKKIFRQLEFSVQACKYLKFDTWQVWHNVNSFLAKILQDNLQE